MQGNIQCLMLLVVTDREVNVGVHCFFTLGGIALRCKQMQRKRV